MTTGIQIKKSGRTKVAHLRCASYDQPVVDRSSSLIRKPPLRMPANGVIQGIRRFFLPRPEIVKKKRIRCGRCVSVCPVTPKAIRQTATTAFPSYVYRICIRCYCCQEAFPWSVVIIRDPLLVQFFLIVPFITLLFLRRASRGQSKHS